MIDYSAFVILVGVRSKARYSSLNAQGYALLMVKPIAASTRLMFQLQINFIFKDYW